MERLTKREGKHTVRIGNEWRRHDPVWDRLAYYEDMEEKGSMTVKELKEKLNQFDDNLIVMIPNINWNPYGYNCEYVLATNAAKGVNEFDGCVFIDDYKE